MGCPTKRKRKLGVRVEPTPDKSWLPGRKGQGGEGFSDGYGGSAGSGLGPSGPQTDTEALDDEHGEHAGPDKNHSPSFPTRERIARVLR
jgi:hypothetical protein